VVISQDVNRTENVRLLEKKSYLSLGHTIALIHTNLPTICQNLKKLHIAMRLSGNNAGIHHILEVK